IKTPHGLRTCFQARIPRNGKKDLVARFGGIPLRRNKNGFITDPVPVLVPTPRKELIHRLRTRRCELCGQGATVAIHQIAKLARLGTPGPGQPAWAALMGPRCIKWVWSRRGWLTGEDRFVDCVTVGDGRAGGLGVWTS
ncbi:MAG: hypothetical protein LC700_03515, partial [Actinobacteria bacterium]|nr:hypothetical protein [Actinomycetota bacterium]